MGEKSNEKKWFSHPNISVGKQEVSGFQNCYSFLLSFATPDNVNLIMTIIVIFFIRYDDCGLLASSFCPSDYGALFICSY